MEQTVLDGAGRADVIVMAAAVADFRPKAVASEKLKKAEGIPEIVLEPTTDILAALGASRRPGQILVGFAAETGRPGTAREDVLHYARSKLASKGADLIVANDVAAPDTGFSHDTNAVIIVGSDGTEVDVPLTSKQQVARAVVDAISKALTTHKEHP
jgi:phosphopantothenoylcysteine decarboxylase/phosphopantothenate--cysteine ligase